MSAFDGLRRRIRPDPGSPRDASGRRRGWAGLLLMSVGCATSPPPPVHDPLLGASVQQAVTVETPGCSVVACELRNDKGTWTVPSTPGTVTLTTSRQPLSVSCRADSGVLAGLASPSTRAAPSGTVAVAGGAVGGAAVGAALGATALSFIPVLGVIAIATGVAVGAASAQAVESTQQALLYPSRIVVAMECAPASGK